MDAHDSDSEPGGFALSVDLSPYVGTPARCRVWVRRRARKVCWLASRIRRVACLRGPMLLLVGDHLLPPDEPMRVIHSDDTLSVARVEHKWQRPFRFDDDEDASESTNVASISPKNLSDRETLLENPSPELLKHRCAREPESIIQFSMKPALKRQYTPTMEDTSAPVTKFVDHASLTDVKQRALALLQQVTGEVGENGDVVDAPKKKRRRVRRRRPVRNENLSFDDPNSQTEKQNGFESFPKSMEGLPTVRQHSEEDSDSPVNAAQDSTAHSEIQSVSQSPTVQLSMVSSAVPSPMVVTCPPPPALVRNLTAARAPRVVRALSVEPIPKIDTLVCRASSVH